MNASVESLSYAASESESDAASTVSSNGSSVLVELDFAQIKKTVTCRKVDVENPREGQARRAFETTTRTERLFVETAATPPDLMFARRRAQRIPAEQVAPPIVARAAPPAAMPAAAANGARFQTVLNRFFRPNRGFAPGRNATAGPSRKHSRPPSVNEEEEVRRKIIVVDDSSDEDGAAGGSPEPIVLVEDSDAEVAPSVVDEDSGNDDDECTFENPCALCAALEE